MYTDYNITNARNVGFWVRRKRDQKRECPGAHSAAYLAFNDVLYIFSEENTHS